MKSSKLLIVIFLFGFSYLFILQIQAIWPFTIDDMYIPLRYARHWAAGSGLVWNIGEPPVEGYSNFSFVVLARLALSAGLDPVFLLKSIGVLGLFLTCLATYAISRFWFVAHFSLIPCVWLLMYKGQILWSVSGLETTLYQALISFVIFFIFRGLGYNSYPEKKEENSRKAPLVIAGFLLALAGMTRPEAPALMLLVVFLLWFNQSRPVRPIILFVCSLGVYFGPYFLWRWHYYGRLFPNPVYCKGFANAMDLTLAKNYLYLIWPFMLLSIPAIWRNQDRRHYFLWLPSIVYLILLLGADPVAAFANRLFLPAFVLLLPLALQGLQILIFWYLKQDDHVLNAGLYLGAFLLAFFLIPSMSLADYHHFSQLPQVGERLRQNVVDWLEQYISPNSQIVLADSGLIPYRSPHQFIDSYCLNNAEMTKDSVPMMYRRLCQKMLVTKPSVIILTSLRKEGKVFYTPADACLSSALISGDKYQLQMSLSTGDRNSVYRYEIYKRIKE